MTADDQPPELRKPVDIGSTPAQRAPSALPSAFPSAPHQGYGGYSQAGYGGPPPAVASQRSRRPWLWAALVAGIVVLVASLVVLVITLV